MEAAPASLLILRLRRQNDGVGLTLLMTATAPRRSRFRLVQYALLRKVIPTPKLPHCRVITLSDRATPSPARRNRPSRRDGLNRKAGLRIASHRPTDGHPWKPGRSNRRRTRVQLSHTTYTMDDGLLTIAPAMKPYRQTSPSPRTCLRAHSLASPYASAHAAQEHAAADTMTGALGDVPSRPAEGMRQLSELVRSLQNRR